MTTTREFIKKYFEQHQELKGIEIEKDVLKNLYIAQDSDWNWWYGDDHSYSSSDKFDYI